MKKIQKMDKTGRRLLGDLNPTESLLWEGKEKTITDLADGLGHYALENIRYIR